MFWIDGLPLGRLGRQDAPLQNVQNNTWLLADMEFSSRDIELNSSSEIPYLRAPMYYYYSLSKRLLSVGLSYHG